MQTQTNILSIGAVSKTALEDMVLESIEVIGEEGGALKTAEAISCLEYFIKQYRANERFQALLMEELDKENGKITLPTGSKIERCETGISYNYSQNQKWIELNTEIESLLIKKKELEDRLKKVPAGMLLVDNDTGEALIGPSKSSKTSYKLTLAK